MTTQRLAHVTFDLDGVAPFTVRLEGHGSTRVTAHYVPGAIDNLNNLLEIRIQVPNPWPLRRLSYDRQSLTGTTSLSSLDEEVVLA